jgi:hypothetical protein
VALFGALFAARTDVYAVRWENTRTGKAGWLPAVRGGWRKGVHACLMDRRQIQNDAVGDEGLNGIVHFRHQLTEFLAKIFYLRNGKCPVELDKDETVFLHLGA